MEYRIIALEFDADSDSNTINEWVEEGDWELMQVVGVSGFANSTEMLGPPFLYAVMRRPALSSN